MSNIMDVAPPFSHNTGTQSEFKVPHQLFNFKQSRFQSDASLRLLERVFDTEDSWRQFLCDTLLVAIDLEYNDETKSIREVGTATLDLMDIHNRSTDDKGYFQNAISSRLFIMSEPTLRPHQRLKKYLFGESQDAKGRTLQDILLPILAPVNASGVPRGVILVGHSIAIDIDVMQQYGDFDLRTLSSIKAVVDTAWIPVLRPFQRPLSLVQTCRHLHLKPTELHNAGNDAMYTLKAALLLFVRYKCDKYLHQINVLALSIEEERAFVKQHQLCLLSEIARADSRIFESKDKRAGNENQIEVSGSFLGTTDPVLLAEDDRRRSSPSV